MASTASPWYLLSVNGGSGIVSREDLMGSMAIDAVRRNHQPATNQSLAMGAVQVVGNEFSWIMPGGGLVDQVCVTASADVDLIDPGRTLALVF
jgi:hypothetical protein